MSNSAFGASIGRAIAVRNLTNDEENFTCKSDSYMMNVMTDLRITDEYIMIMVSVGLVLEL